MKDTNKHNLLLIGLPSTGKTSFLAALWFAVQQRHCPTSLILDRLDGDSAYLNKIRDAWLAFKPVDRNPTDSETFVSMRLKRGCGDETAHLTFPDVSGESFKQQWTARQLTSSYDECLTTASAGLLFVHSSSIKHPQRIAEVDDLAALIDASVRDESISASMSAGPSTPWDIERAPTQVQLVELLQFMTRHPEFRSPFRLGIAISAWDLVPSSPQITPDEWVARETPLLSQFLLSNRKRLEVAFYGVSAQGGEYGGSSGEALQSKLPARRIEVAGKGVKNKHDITEPLLWLMRSP